LIFLSGQLSNRWGEVSFKLNVSFKGSDFDIAQRSIDLKCPQCQAANSVTLGQVQREETVTCVGCKRNIRLVDKDKSVAKTVSKVNEAMDDLKKAVEDLGR
jgi:Zn ribbon nucleic-acid-binding protein